MIRVRDAAWLTLLLCFVLLALLPAVPAAAQPPSLDRDNSEAPLSSEVLPPFTQPQQSETNAHAWHQFLPVVQNPWDAGWHVVAESCPAGGCPAEENHVDTVIPNTKWAAVDHNAFPGCWSAEGCSQFVHYDPSPGRAYYRWWAEDYDDAWWANEAHVTWTHFWDDWNTLPYQGEHVWRADWDGDRNGITNLIRSHFSLPSDFDVTSARLATFSDNSTAVWANGTLVAERQSDGTGLYLNPEALQPGDNVLAIQLSNDNVCPRCNPIGVQFRLEVKLEATTPDTTPTPTLTPSSTAAVTATPTQPAPGTGTPTATPTGTSTPGPSPTATSTHTPGPSPTPTSTNTPGPSPTATSTNTPGPTPTPTSTTTSGPSPTSTATATATSTNTPGPSPTATTTPGPSATSTATATPAPLSSKGMITGEVYNAGTGAPLADVTVQILGINEPTFNQSLVTRNSDEDGRFRLPREPGTVELSISKSGFTPAYRVVEVVAGKRTNPFDARLTPLDSNGQTVPAAAGGTVTSEAGTASLVIPAFALDADQLVSVTEIDAQSLVARLPRGWSPVATVDVAPHDLTVNDAATLSVATPDTLAENTVLVIARWDDVQHQWIALGTTTGANLEFGVTQGGQYSFLTADTSPYDPPLPSSGEAIAGSTPAGLTADVDVTLSPSPRILFSQSGEGARVGVQASADTAIQSGIPVQIGREEAFTFATNANLHLPPRMHDYVLYAYPAGAQNLQSSFETRPSRSFAHHALQLGIIDLAAHISTTIDTPYGAVVTPDGGLATAAGGESLRVPPGATGTDLPVHLSPLPESQFPISVTNGISFVSGVTVDLHGASLDDAAQLSVPTPAGVSEDSQNLLLVQIVEVAEVSYLRLVAGARVQNGSLTSITDPLGDGSVSLPGIRRGGRYAFVQAGTSLGYVSGQAAHEDGTPLVGGLISIDTLPIVATTDDAGNYALAAPVGDVQVTALDPDTLDTLTQSSTISENSVLTLELSLAPLPPSVFAVTPSDGATDVSRLATVGITMSEAISSTSVTTQSVVLTGPNGSVPASRSLSPNGRVVTLRPDSRLASAAAYTLTVTTALSDLDGEQMQTPFTATFVTADETPPPPPPAGSVIAAIPNADGVSVVTGTQGIAEPGWTVVIKNLTTGDLTTVLPESDGSFTARVPADIVDKLQLILRDEAGNETTVDIGPFRGPDGTVVIGSDGGRVEGDGGVAVTIPPDALPDGTLVKVEPLAESDFAIAAPAEYPFVKGVNLDLNGAIPEKELDLSVPAPADAQQDDQVIVARQVEGNGQTGWMPIDRAYLQDDGAYETASPPFPSVVGEGEYAFLRAEGDCVSYVAVNFHVEFDPLVLTSPTVPFLLTSDVFETEINNVVFPGVCNQQMDIVVRTANTDDLIRRMTRQAPAARDAIDFGSGDESRITEDTTPPTVVQHNLYDGYQLEHLFLRFSEPLDTSTVLSNMRVIDKRTGDAVSGNIEFQDSDSALTFRPDAALQLGHHYQVLLTGATDRAGNPLETTTFDVALFEPQALSDLEQFFTQHKGIEDGIAGTQAATSIGDDLFVAYQDPQTQRQRLLAMDTRTPDTPIQLGDVDTGLYRLRAMAPIDDVILTLDNPPSGQDPLFAENTFTVLISTTEIISGLNSSQIVPVLRTEFSQKHESLSQDAGVSVRVPDAQWFIHDGNNRYFIQEESGRLQVYTGRDLLVVIGTTEQPSEATEGGLTELLEIYDVTECTQRNQPAPDATPVDSSRDCFENFSDMLVGRKWLLDPRNRLPIRFQDLVPNEVGVPTRLAVLHQDDTAPASRPVDDTAAVYVVSAGVGLQSVDVSRSFNSDNPMGNPEPHGLVRGRFTDVAVLKDRVLATEDPLEGSAPRLTMLTASLSDTQTVDGQTVELPKFEFPDAGVFGVTAAPNVLYDLDDDGNSGLAEEDDSDFVDAIDEVHDLALVTSEIIAPEGTGELYVLDLSAWTNLDHDERTFPRDALVSRIELPGHGRSVRVRTEERVAYVEMSGIGLGIVPLRHLAPALENRQSFAASIELEPQDDNFDGRDDRLVGVYHMPALAPRGKIAVDDADKRPLAYVNEFNAGVELVQFCNPCPDLILDFQTEETFDPEGAGTQADTSDLARELERERQIVLDIINQTVEDLRANDVISPTTPLVLLEQGSGSCLWRDEFESGDNATKVQTCSAFQPGRSDHDVEVLVPSNKVEAVQKGIDAFMQTEPDGLDQLEDLSLFAMPLEPFEAARLLTVPSFNEVGDTAGDMGLGRQNLMLLWLLTGEYVEGYEGVSLDNLLDEVQNDDGTSPFMPGEPTGIPRLEGYEWGLLQEFNLYKTGARLRIDGACDFGDQGHAGEDYVAAPTETDVYDITDPARNFQEFEALNKDCDDQLHTVAKAAIRATFALMVSDARTNKLIQGRAKAEDPSTGLPTTDPQGNVETIELTRDSYLSNYCLTDVPDPLNPPSDPWAYGEKACEGFEEFIATMAIDSVRRGYTVTTASELPLIVKFWCVKVGDGCRKNGEPAQPIRTDEEANQFMADAIQFIEKVQERAAPTYNQTIASDDTPIEDLAPTFPFIEKVRETCTNEPIGLPSIEERDDLRRCNVRVIDLKINGEDPATAQQQYFDDRHLINATTVDKREVKKLLGVKNVVPINFQVRARNVSPLELYGVDIGMYESAGEQEANYGEPVTTYSINTLLADEKRVIDAYKKTDSFGNEKKVEIFPTLVSISDTLEALNGDADGSRALAFFIDPDQEYVEIDKHNNQAGFHYYVLDDGGNPTQTESRDSLPFLLKPEDIEPNAICRTYSGLDINFTIQGENAENNFGDKVLTSQVYKSVAYTYLLYNRGDKPLHDIEVVRKGRVVARVDNLAPGERTLQTEEFVPAQAQVYRPTAIATAQDADGNTVGPARDSATLYAREGGEYTIKYYDDSALSDPTHPFSRYLLHINQDTAEPEPIVGAVTDGDQNGNGGRIRIEITGIEDESTPMTVSLEDQDMPGVIEGVGWLEYEKDGQVIRDVIIEDIDPSVLGTVTLYYVPPPAFVRDNYRQEDLFNSDGSAKVERKVRLRAYQTGAGSATQPIRLRRPPVFLVHGLGGTPDVWDEFQPLVPAGGVGGGHTFVKSADGRFDVHAAGSILTDRAVVTETEELKSDLELALYNYLEGYSIGRVDVVANSMGGLITRELGRKFQEDLGRQMPFRKLVTIGTPHLGSPLADKIIDTRDKLPLKAKFLGGADVLKISKATFAEYLKEGDTASQEKLVKDAIAIEWCAAIIQAMGSTPRYNIYNGALEDLAVNSSIQKKLNTAGVLIPSHYVTGESIERINTIGVPTLAESVQLQLLWSGLGVACNWTPDSSTVDTTKTIRATAEAAKMLMPLMKAAKLASANRYKKLMDIFTGGGVDMIINEVFGKDPEPILSDTNDRVVDLRSQEGALSGSRLTRVVDHTDHLDIKESNDTVATVDFCNTYLRDVFLSLDGQPRTTLDDKNLVPCQIIALLELSPESGSFYTDNSSARAPTKSAMASPLTLKLARADIPAPSDSLSSAGTTGAPEPNVAAQTTSLDLDVVAPAPNSVVQAGGTVQVQVEPPTGVTLQELAFVTSDSFTTTVDGALQGMVPIPESAVGHEFIVAYGVSSDGDILIDYVEVLVDPGRLVNLSVAAPARMTTRGAVEQLRVTGRFADGVTRDLTRPAAGTSYESTNESVLKVTPSGLVQVVDNGRASLIVTNRHPVDGSIQLTDVPIEVDITESVTNRIPVATATGPVTATTEMTVTLSAAGSYDPDGDPLTYNWYQTGGRYVVLRNADTVTPTFSSPLVTETDVLTFQVTVSDNKGATTLPAEVEVTVQP